MQLFDKLKSEICELKMTDITKAQSTPNNDSIIIHNLSNYFIRDNLRDRW